MKKFLLIGIILFILVIIAGSIAAFLQKPVEETPILDTQKDAEVIISPSQISVGLYNGNATSTSTTTPPQIFPQTILFEKRLKEIGFQTTILFELVDPEAAQSEKTTLLFKTDTLTKLDTVTREVLESQVYRKGQNESIAQDVVIASWNIEDINWGEFKNEAEGLLHPQLDAILVEIFNSQYTSDQASSTMLLLQENGYSRSVVSGVYEEEDALGRVIIYYDRNFKEVAKDIRKLLSENGYEKITYRPRIGQETNIVIQLGSVVTKQQEAGNAEIQDQKRVQAKSSLTITVLNGSGISGIAGKAAQKLNSLGYTNVTAGNAENSNYEKVLILYKKDFKGSAMDIGDALKEEFGEFIEKESQDITSDIEIIIGT